MNAATFELLNFDSFAFDYLPLGSNPQVISQDLVISWSKQRSNEKISNTIKRMSVLREYLRFYVSLGCDAFIPKMPKFKSDYSPYIFTKDEIKSILSESDKFLVDMKKKCSCMPVIVRLLYGTGMRIGEVLNIQESDVDLENNLILLRNTKNGKDRIITINLSIKSCLLWYFEYSPNIRNEKLFDIKIEYVRYLFKQIFMNCDIHNRDGKYPRIHSFRYAFCIHSLVDMLRRGLDLYEAFPILSAYIGHLSLEATEPYVRLASLMYPELLKRSNRICSSIFPDFPEIVES
jgi:integrase